MSNTTDEANARLGRIIAKECKEIERRWLDRVMRDIVKTPSVEITQLRDGMPHYLDALVTVLCGEARDGIAQGAHGAWTAVAREHGVTRVQIGFNITQLVHEFIVLRQGIRDVVCERGMPVEQAEGALADIRDAAISAAVEAYVDARDFQARGVQAQNVAFLTHELRNPLSTALMTAANLRKRVPAESERLIDTLERSLKRLDDLIDGVLLTQSLEAGKVQARPVEVPLGEVMEPALEAARTAAEHKGLAFKASYDPEAVVRLDPLLTRSAIQNLADNATKYTDAGGVDIAVHQGPDGLRIDICDTCQGLSPTELGTIFEPFQRGRTGKTGTGLGLTIARRAVEAQGGTLDAESSGSVGCHFWISLPANAGAGGGT